MKFFARLPRPRRLPALQINSLEERANPASATYTALTQTLTVTAAEGDWLVIAGETNKPTGYITLKENQANVTVFDSDATNQGVRNVIVKFGNVQNGDFVLDSTAVLGGSLTIGGAKSTQSVALFGAVGGNVVYTAAPAPAAASDQFNVEPTTVIGGNLSLNLSNGANTTRLKGGTIRGNLTLIGLGGTDRVEITESADLTIGLAASFNLGNGNNTVIGLGTHMVRVGGSFTYTGGIGNDTFNLDSSGAGLTAGVDARFTLGTPLGFDSNEASFELLSANRNISIVGGAGLDAVESSGLLASGGNLTVNLGAGDNSFDSNQGGIGTNTIGGTFTYIGGMNGDAVFLDNTSIGRNVTLSLGDAIAGTNTFATGTEAPGQVTVYGNVKITDGPSDSSIYLQRLYVGGSLNVLGGTGIDTISVDDSQVAGPTLFDLGAGNDNLNVEMGTSNSGGPLSGVSTFGSTFTVKGGDGTDGVSMTVDNVATQQVQFGGKVALYGGAGIDTLSAMNGVQFELTGNLDDFEIANKLLP